jgi:hypothetical protein
MVSMQLSSAARFPAENLLKLRRPRDDKHRVVEAAAQISFPPVHRRLIA